jgi:putative hydrolase
VTPLPVVDRHCDLHTHSDLTDGADSPEAMADAAQAAGLHTWGLSDHVRADSDWVPEYVTRVRALRRDGLVIRCGVEAKILDDSGRLDVPAGLPSLDYVLVADHQFPSVDGPVSPREMARRLGAGETTPEAVVETLIRATCAAVAQAPAPVIVVVHPFSLLPKMGLSEDALGDDHLRSLAEACRRADASIEINEKWRCPSAATLARLAALGVDMVAGSDAHRTADVGSWSYLDQVSERPHQAVR